MGDQAEVELSARALKRELFGCLRETRQGCAAPQVGLSVARQAREIVNITRVQLQAAKQSERNVPADVIAFTEG